MNKILISLLSFPMLLTACGENSSNLGNENQSKRENKVISRLNISAENSQQKALTTQVISTDDTQPVYRYAQLIDLDNDSLLKSYQVTYNFKVDHDYSLVVFFDGSKSQPSKIQLWISTKTPELSELFTCGDKQYPTCENILFDVDHKTGHSKINFNQTKIYDYDRKVLTLSGVILGQLQQNPTLVKLPTSGIYDATYQLSNNPQYIPMTHSNYKYYIFTNHNINEFITSNSFFDNTVYIKTVNNLVNDVWYRPSMEYPLSLWSRENNTNLQNTSYNSINLTVSFNQFKLSNENYPDLFINGTIGP
ncbi:hypothetical protein [Acinetobacter sp. ANC 4648]|uniref:hypothetical protein n=1 Tax=Acinetobacter sp. ANC 4648 TaxID=1977875 RepID=UPI000A335859|nr:hypothetical protein [Acinetobacter sp. ANC 4648]OTG83069.1 hypothetical protein B9T27_07305 [Acinetobacter sp. ANC 4648]